MKALLKTIGIIAMAAIIGFTMTGCPPDDNGGGGGGGGNQEDGGFLTEGVWKDGEIAVADGSVTYKVSVTTGKTYRFWWNDSKVGNGFKTLDISVTITYSDGTVVSSSLNEADSAWNSSWSFTSTKDDTVNIKVIAKTSGDIGTFGIVYRTDVNTKPPTLNIPGDAETITSGIWKSGEFTESVTEFWYKFSGLVVTDYRFWWNDSKAGNGSATADILVGVWNGNETAQFVNADSAWNISKTFNSPSTTTYYVRVTPKIPGATGTFNIIFNTSNSTEHPWLTPLVTTELNEREWKNDSITSNSCGEKWYSFIPENSGTKYVYWNDSKAGNGNATLDIRVSAYNSTGSYSFLDIDSGWNTNNTITTTAENKYYIRVLPATAGNTGSFDIIYNNTNQVPWLTPLFPTELTAGEWENGEIMSTNDEKWYTFTAGEGTYRIWWNGAYLSNGDGTKTSNLLVAGWKNEGISLFTNNQTGWSTPQNPTLSPGDKVYIRVRGYYESIGTFGIVYTEDDAARPFTFTLPATIPTLPADVWTDVSINSVGGEAWYSIDTPTNGDYYIWWNDSLQGDGSKNLDVIVNVWVDNGSALLWDGGRNPLFDSGWVSWGLGYNRTNAANTKLYIKITPKTAGETGTFAITYTRTNQRPWTDPINPTPLSVAQWADDSVSSSSEVWFSFTATSGTYYLWTNSRFSDGTKDASITTTFYLGGIQITPSGSSDGWKTPYSLTISSAGTVYVKVTANSNNNYYGTFGIAYTTSSARPASIAIPAESSMRPLTVDSWTDGEITESNSEIWYIFTSTTNNTYRFWWNDKGQGDNTKTLDVLVSAWDTTGTIITGAYSIRAINVDSGWTTNNLSETLNGTSIYIRVTPKNPGEIGTFGITCSQGSSSTRPPVPTTP
jgi:hypothetical protein